MPEINKCFLVFNRIKGVDFRSLGLAPSSLPFQSPQQLQWGFASRVGLCAWMCSLVPDSLQPWTVACPPGSSIHGIFRARILEWVAISFPRGSSSRHRDWTLVSPHCGQILYHLSHQRSLFFSLPTIKSSTSPKTPGFFCWRWFLEAKIWTLDHCSLLLGKKPSVFKLWNKSYTEEYIKHISMV